MHDDGPLGLLIELNAIAATHPDAAHAAVERLRSRRGLTDAEIIDIFRHGTVRKFQRELALVAFRAGGDLRQVRLSEFEGNPWYGGPTFDLDDDDEEVEGAMIRHVQESRWSGPIRAGGLTSSGMNPSVPPPEITWHKAPPSEDAAGAPGKPAPPAFWARVPDHGGTVLHVHRCRLKRLSPDPWRAPLPRWMVAINRQTLRDPEDGRVVFFVSCAAAMANAGAIIRCPTWAIYFGWEPSA
jgi:hypothetical protein